MTTMAPKPVGANVVSKRQGLDAYAMYVELIEYWPSSGEIRAHHFFFLAENTLSVSTRQGNNKQARWKLTKYDDFEAAKAVFERRVAAIEANRLGTEMRGQPVLIQLTEVDVEQIRKGETPLARYAGQHNLDKRLGKFDAKTWRPERWGGTV